MIKETSPTIIGVLGLLILAAPVFGWLSASPSLHGNGFIWKIITGGTAEPEGEALGHLWIPLIINLVLAVAVFAIFANGKRRESVLGMLKGLRFGSFGPLTRKFYFDDVYAALITTPLKGAAYLSRLILENIFTGLVTVVGMLGRGLSLALRRLQTGKAHQYAIGVLLAVFLLAFYLGGR